MNFLCSNVSGYDWKIDNRILILTKYGVVWKHCWLLTKGYKCVYREYEILYSNSSSVFLFLLFTFCYDSFMSSFLGYPWALSVSTNITFIDNT